MSEGQDIYRNLLSDKLAGEDNATLANAALSLGADTAPPVASKAIRLSERTGLPTEVVKNNLGDVERMANMDGYRSLLKAAPVTARHISDPMHAAAARDDLLNLTEFEKQAKDLRVRLGRNPNQNLAKGAYGIGVQGEVGSFAIDRLMTGVLSRFVETFGNLPDKPGAAPGKLAGDATSGTVTASLVDTVKKYNAMPEEDRLAIADRIYEDAMVRGSRARGVWEWGKYVAQNPMALVNVVAKGLAESTTSGAQGGLAAGALRKRGMSEAMDKAVGTAAAAAGGTFGADIGAETAGKFNETGDIEASVAYGAQKAAVDAAVQIPFAAAGSLFGDLGGPASALSFGQRAGRGAGSDIIGAAGGGAGAVAAAVSVGEDASLSEFLSEMAADGAMVPFNQMIGEYSARKDRAERLELENKIKSAQEMGDKLGTLLKAAGTSTYRQELPESFAQLARNAADMSESPIEDVFINARKLQEVVGEARLQELRAVSPELDAQLDVAINSDADVAIPFEQLAAHFTGAGFEAELAKHVKIEPDGFSAEEAKTALESFAQEAAGASLGGDEEAWREESDKIFEDTFANLESVGRFSPYVNKAYASIIRDFYSTTAKRAGTTPAALAKQFPLTISGESVGEKSLGTKSALEQKAVDTAARLAKEIGGLQRALKYMTPGERSKLQRNTATKLVDLMKQLPSAEEMAAVAHAGSAKRGWYKNSAQALVTVFGPDAPRFAALLAATSPQTSVENNLVNALNIWKNWVAEGRPTNRDAIVKVMGRSVMGTGTDESVLPAWINNSVRALTIEDVSKILLSGPKVDSFMLNLIGVTEEVTNDAWMANYALVDQKLFSGTGFNEMRRDPGKGYGYIAMSVNVRRAAEILTRKTGEAWTPAEVQETIWSWAKTLYELHDSAGETRSPQQLLADGALTDDLINSTPDFRSLFNEATNQEILTAAGYGEQLGRLADVDNGPAVAEATGAEGKAAPFDTSIAERHLRRAAGRLAKLRKMRRDGRADDSLEQSDTQNDTQEGRKFKDFFASITSGTAGAPKTSAASVKVLNRERNNDVVNAFMKHSGNFDRHIEASIPGFRDIQFVVADAITKTYKYADVLDIGASEGALVKTVSELGNNIRAVGLDPNPEMAKTFREKSTVEGATYDMSALGAAEQEGKPAWTEDDGTEIRYFKPDRKFQVVHEAMVFQFISNDREQQVARVAELLADDGVAIFEEKFIQGDGLSDAEWRNNERMKDAFKEQFFPKEELKAKAESVLVGMNKNMVSPGEFELTLESNFKFVRRFWKSGNFMGYIASNDQAKFEQMLSNIGDTSSPFDGSQTTSSDDALAQTETETPKTGSPVFVTAYHGSRRKTSDFSDFSKSADGAPFFSASREHADKFGESVARKLVMKNPLVITNENLESRVSEEDEANDIIPRMKIRDVIAEAKAAGHDGLVILGFYDTGVTADTYIPFTPEQIKLPTQEQGDLFSTAQELEAMEAESAKEKGLDMSLQARLARAKAMGFDTSRRWYHASNKSGFLNFEVSTKGKTAGTGIFMTDSNRMAGTYMRGLGLDAKIGRADEIIDNPQAYGFNIAMLESGELEVTYPNGDVMIYMNEEQMLKFLNEEISKGDVRFNEQPGMYELFVKVDEKDTLVIDWEGRYWSDGPVTGKSYDVVRIDKAGLPDYIEVFYDRDEAEQYVAENSQDGDLEIREADDKEFQATDDAARGARAMGYSAVEIRNVVDPGPWGRVGDVEGTVLVVMDPANIRSVNAAFDPEFASSASVLAQSPKTRLGEFHPPTLTLSMLERANLSTFLHETGHFFFEVTAMLAAQNDAAPGIVSDVNAMLKFVGYTGTAEQWLREPIGRRREGHEKVAESFEQYLATGKAPTLELQPLFATFRRWLLNVYQSIQNMLRVNKRAALDEEIAAVFDRMLATDEAIAQAAEVRSLMPQFQSAEEAGMSVEEWAAYQRDVAATTGDAADDIRARMVRDMQWLGNARKRTLVSITKDAQAKRKSVLEEVNLEVGRMPVYRAIEFLKRGVLTDSNGVELQDPVTLGSTKLNRDVLKAMYPNGEVDLQKLGFGKYGMMSADGMDPGAVASLFGFRSGDELVRAVLDAEKRAELVSALADQRMLERYGDIATQEGLQRAADEALANEAHSRMVATELLALDKRLGKTAYIRKAAKYSAMGILEARAVRLVRPDLAAAAAARARRDSKKALSTGKRDEAVAAKRNEMLHSELQVQGILIKREFEKFLRDATKVFKGRSEQISKTRDMDLVNAARAILATYGVGPDGAGRAATQYMALLDKYDGARAADIKSMRAALPPVHPKGIEHMSVADMRTVRDVALGIFKLAKSEKQVTIDGNVVALDDVATEIVDAVIARDGGIGDLPGYSNTPGTKERFVDAVHSARATLMRVEFWADWMGPVFKRYIWQPVSEATTTMRIERGKLTQRYLELLKTIEKDLTYTPIAAPELNGFVFSGGKSEVLHAVLHSGNSSNLTKLLVGRGWGQLDANGNVDSTKWKLFVDRLIKEGTLTKADFDFAQSVWDLLEEIKPQAQKSHHAMYGYYFKEVTSDEFTVDIDGATLTYRGGYVPAIADPLSSKDIAQKREAEELLHAGNSFMFPTTGKGFTQSRVSFNRPLELDLRVIGQHIDKVSRFIWLEPAIRDVGKIINNKRVQRALNGADGAVISRMLNPWLQRTARQSTNKPGLDSNFDKFANALRTRSGMVIMFGNVVNTLQQITGFSLAAIKVPAGHLARANISMFTSRKKLVTFATEKSPWLKDRMEGQTYEMQAHIDKILTNPNVVESSLEFMKRNAYFMQQAVQNYMDLVIWTGAYNNALVKGADDKQSVRYADEAVRTTQGSFAAEDVSSFETNNAFVRLFTQFYSYFNMNANLLGVEWSKAVREMGYGAATPRLAFIYFAGLALPAVVAQIISQGVPNDDDDEDADGMLDEWVAFIFSTQARTLAAMAPGVGQVAQLGFNLNDDKVYNDRLSISPAVSMIEAGTRAVFQASYFDERLKKTEVRDALTLIGLATGAPTGPIARAAGYEIDVNEGRKSPEGVVDYVVGYTTGK